MKNPIFVRIVGARPQFIQAAMLRKEFDKRGIKEILIHTGQHFDYNMSGVFFEELHIPAPDGFSIYNLGCKDTDILTMTYEIRKVLEIMNCAAVIVDGDTNSTFAGALASIYCKIPLVHIEAGMRSFEKNMNDMPEERNRIFTDAVSDVLFCPCENAAENLKKEGREKGVYVVGDLMAEYFFTHIPRLAEFEMPYSDYALMTLHRQENVNNPEALKYYIGLANNCPIKVVWVLHPRTKKMIQQFDLAESIQNENLIMSLSVSGSEMKQLEIGAKFIMTDSGGVQREAYHLQKPCHILRDRTEWTEIVKSGFARLLPPFTDINKIDWCFDVSNCEYEFCYGKDNVAEKITDKLIELF